MVDNDNAPRTGSNNPLYFIVGGLVVLAGIGIFLYTNGYVGHGSSDINVTVEQPTTSEPGPAATPAAPTGEAPAAAPAGSTTNQ